MKKLSVLLSAFMLLLVQVQPSFASEASDHWDALEDVIDELEDVYDDVDKAAEEFEDPLEMLSDANEDLLDMLDEYMTPSNSSRIVDKSVIHLKVTYDAIKRNFDDETAALLKAGLAHRQCVERKEVEQKEAPKVAEPVQGEPAQPAQGEPAQPAQGEPAQPAQGEATPAQPAQGEPAQGKPAQTPAQKPEGECIKEVVVYPDPYSKIPPLLASYRSHLKALLASGRYRP